MSEASKQSSFPELRDFVERCDQTSIGLYRVEFDKLIEQYEAMREALALIAGKHGDVPADAPTWHTGRSWRIELARSVLRQTSNQDVMATEPPPDEDMQRASELARERGWRNIGGQGVTVDPNQEGRDDG